MSQNKESAQNSTEEEDLVYEMDAETASQMARMELERRAQFMNKTSLCDAVIKTEDGGSFLVHKSILARCSRYFQALFSARMGNGDRCHFTIPEVGRDMMQLVVTHAYTGKTDVDEENVEKLLPVADYLFVVSMIKDCAAFLLPRINSENCIGFRKFARTYYCKELEKAADRHLRNHLPEVSGAEEFLELGLDDLVEILNSDHLQVPGEEQVWEAAVRWVDHRPDERARCMPDVMRCVRLGLLDPLYFSDLVQLNKHVANNEQCKPFVIDTLKFLWVLEEIGRKTEPVETPFLATPRIPHTIMFTIGGWSGGSPTNCIETYDTKAERWITVGSVDERARSYHKLAVLGHDIYVIGGFDGNEYFNSCRVFNVDTQQWRSVAPMNTRRCYVSVATLDDDIYAMGGYDGHYRQNTTERYDRNRNQWYEAAPMDTQRSDACAATLDGRIYIVGGFNGTECMSSSEAFDPGTGAWSNIPSMRSRRSGVSAIAHQGHIYALGGFNGTERLLSCERYDPVAEQWTSVPDMSNPRSNFAVEVMDDMIFAIGGFNGITTISKVECYDSRNSEWLQATDMHVMRSALAAGVVREVEDVRTYAHPDRTRLMEEKRLELLQQAILFHTHGDY